MCGIIVYLSTETAYDKQMHSLLHNMLWIDTIRGDHSTGIIYQVDKEVDYYKKAVPGYDFVELPVPAKILSDHNKTRFLIGHNRAATRGNVNSKNAHPFEMSHIIGVHNGTLSNHHTLTPNGVNYQVDSQHLYHAIAEEGSKKVLPKVDGSFNLVWHDSSDNTIHICRNKDRPFTFAKVKGKETMIGASEKDMLKWLMKRHGYEIEFCWTPENNVEYIFEQNDGCEVLRYKHEIKHEEFKRPVYTPPTISNYQKKHKDPGKTTTASLPIKDVDFYLDMKQENPFLINGKRSWTAFGEDSDKNEVIVNMIMEDDNIDCDVWYRASAVSKVLEEAGKKTFYRSIIKDTIREVTITDKKTDEEKEDEEALNICQHCGNDSHDWEVVWIDNAPLCIECCHSFNVTEDWLDDAKVDGPKLKVN